MELQTGSIMDVKEQKGSFKDTLNQSCAYSPIRRTPFILVTLRLRGRVGRDGFKVHFGTVLGDVFSTWRQIRPPKQSHNALDNYLDLVPLQPQSGQYSQLSLRRTPLGPVLSVLFSLGDVHLTESQIKGVKEGRDQL